MVQFGLTMDHVDTALDLEEGLEFLNLRSRNEWAKNRGR
jgi:hypothetical protein